MHILVTGGAGYIGGTAAEALVAAGHQVTVLDNLSHGHRAAVPAGARFVHGDLLDRAGVADLLASEPYEAIMHFAALIEAGQSMQHPGLFFANNVTGSLNLLEEAVRHGVQRLVFSSTAALFAGSDQPLSEAAPIQPANVYGETKRVVEQMLGWYQKVHGLRYAALRYFNAAGALPHRGEAHQPESHLIPRVLSVALGQTEAVTLFGTDYPTPDGTCIRDYLHVVDLAEGHLAALAHVDRLEGAVAVNLGTGVGSSVLDVLEAARAATGHPIPCVMGPRRAGDVVAAWADPTLAAELLGWRATRTLAEMCADHWRWQAANPEGYA